MIRGGIFLLVVLTQISVAAYAQPSSPPILIGSQADKMAKEGKMKVDLSSPPTVNGYKLTPVGDMTCSTSLKYRVEDTAGHGIEPGNEVFVSSIAEIGEALALTCPYIVRLMLSHEANFYTGNSFHFFDRHRGWGRKIDEGIIRNRRMEAYQADLNAFRNRPLPTAQTPNPLSERGIFASEYIGAIGFAKIYAAYPTEKLYYKEPTIVAVHDAPRGHGIFPPEILSVSFYQAGKKNAFGAAVDRLLAPTKLSGFDNQILHYVEAIKAPKLGTRSGTGIAAPNIEAPIAISGFEQNLIPFSIDRISYNGKTQIKFLIPEVRSDGQPNGHYRVPNHLNPPTNVLFENEQFKSFSLEDFIESFGPWRRTLTVIE